MRLFRSALLMLALLFPLSGICCNYNYIGSPYTVDYGNIIVQRDVPLGKQSAMRYMVLSTCLYLPYNRQ
jgi:hypothetical protein